MELSENGLKSHGFWGTIFRKPPFFLVVTSNYTSRVLTTHFIKLHRKVLDFLSPGLFFQVWPRHLGSPRHPWRAWWCRWWPSWETWMWLVNVQYICKPRKRCRNEKKHLKSKDKFHSVTLSSFLSFEEFFRQQGKSATSNLHQLWKTVKRGIVNIFKHPSWGGSLWCWAIAIQQCRVEPSQWLTRNGLDWVGNHPHVEVCGVGFTTSNQILLASPKTLKPSKNMLCPTQK